MATVEELLHAAADRLRVAGSGTPRLDAELLLGAVLGIDRTGVIAHGEAPVGHGSALEFHALLTRRVAGEPVAYLRGTREFLGLAFATDDRALIPRPETELLVELSEAEIVRRLTGAPRPVGAPPVRVVDVGTGSGAIAVSLAVRLRLRRMLDEVDLLAIDDSAPALELAKENAVGHAVADGLRFRESDLIPRDEPPFDLILANLPYVPTAEIDRLVRDLSFEPRHALDGGPDGLDVIRRLVRDLPESLAQTGIALMEIGMDQAAAIAATVATLPGSWSSVVHDDPAGRPRVARVER